MEHDGEVRKAFERKYDGSDADWGGSSGPGSDPYYTLPYRAFLENFLRMNNIGSVVDVGCGDWQFSRYLDLRGIDYLGLDLVAPLVERNRRAFGSSSVRFEVMTERVEDVPGGHLLIVKDVLQHLPIATVQHYLATLLPRFNFALLTSSVRKVAEGGGMMPVNTEVASGDFRCLDLREAPFHLQGAYVLRFYTGAAEELRTLLVQR